MLAQFHQQPVWLGLRGGFALAFVEAQGFTPFGSEASTSEPAIIPEFRFSANVELPFYAGFAFALAFELEARLVRRNFAVNDGMVADLGWLRPVVRPGDRLHAVRVLLVLVAAIDRCAEFGLVDEAVLFASAKPTLSLQIRVLAPSTLGGCAKRFETRIALLPSTVTSPQTSHSARLTLLPRMCRSPSITQSTSDGLFLSITTSPCMRTPRTSALFLSIARLPPMTELSGP